MNFTNFASMKKVAFHTLGCKLNFSETSSLAQDFQQKGYQKVSFQDSADVYIINTCSVTDNANKKCRKVIKEAKKYSPDAFIAIIGCYAQLKPKEIAEIPGVDAVLGASDKFQLFEKLGDFSKNGGTKIFHTDIKEANTFHHAFSAGDRTRTFLKVQDGCNYNCAFCTIPLARGKSRSDEIDEVLNKARKIADSGVKEIVLTGVNIGDYGIINGKRQTDFLSLIKELDQIEGIERIRISSIEPNLLNDHVIEFVSKSQRFVPHFHVPLQSGSDKILKLMRRRYDTGLYTNRIKRIKELMPDCCIGVDVITGHPGETQEEFLKTYNFLNELDISYLHVFTYSERENTAALVLHERVPESERKDRSTQLRTLSHKKREHFYKTQIDKKRKVLFEKDVDNGFISGFTDNYVKVKTAYNPELINEVLEISLKDLAPNLQHYTY